MKRQLALFGIIVLSMFSIACSVPIFADTVAKTTNFEKTTLIQYTNNESVPINTIRMWLASDSGDFKSFKTEKGWVGSLSPEGLLVFTTNSPLPPGDSVKFGLKTEVVNPQINWKSIDSSGNELTVGTTKEGAATKSTSSSSSSPSSPPDQQQNTQPTNLDNVSYRIIPEAPKNGDDIRVVGEGFPANQKIGFFLDNQKLADFTTDGSGHMLGRTEIPKNKEAGRVDFYVMDEQGNKKTISIRLDHRDEQGVTSNNAPLKVTNNAGTVEPGSTAVVNGTAKPGSTVVISYRDPQGNKIQEATVDVDSLGHWSYQKAIPPDAKEGDYQVEFTDGPDKVTKTLTIKNSGSVDLEPSKTRYEVGDTIAINGTVATTDPLEIIIRDPIGKEIFSKVITPGDSKEIDFQYPTTQNHMKGTYIILATQLDDTQIMRVGLGQAPSELIVAKMDKLNYGNSEKAKLTVNGPAKGAVNLLILDPSDKEKTSDTITLGPNGSADYFIDLTDYKAGVYSVVLKRLDTQVTERFGVGLQLGSGPITIQTTKITYQLGDAVLVLGSANSNVLITLEMSDPDGNVVKKTQTFSNKEGIIKDSSFRIPSDAKQGTWKIKASSGSNYSDTPLEVVGTVEQGFVISLDNGTAYHTGDKITITGNGAGATQNAVIQIIDSANVKIQELTIFTTSVGSFQTFWEIPVETPPGDYKVTATVGNDIAEATFTLE